MEIKRRQTGSGEYTDYKHITHRVIHSVLLSEEALDNLETRTAEALYLIFTEMPRLPGLKES